MPALSVIVPVYNAERYLEECLSSIEGQTFRDLEVLCIDDGSTDGSSVILERQAKRDPRLKVFRKENRGLSAARNTGLDNATGDWIAFVDADDTVSPGMYSRLVSLGREENLDAIGCSLMTIPEGKRKEFTFATGRIMDFGTLLGTSEKVESSNDLCFVWRYVFNRKVIESGPLRFREDIRFAEDMVFITEALASSKRILLLEEAPYRYRTDNPDSLMKRTKNPERLNSLPRVHAAKKEQILRLGMDRFSPCTRDLAKYTLRSMLPLLLDALPEHPSKRDVHSILSLGMISDSCRELGLNNPFDSPKEYLYYLAVKFRLSGIVSHLYFR